MAEDVKKSLHGSARSSQKFDANNEQGVTLTDQLESRAPRPDAPWMKDEYDEFENLQEGELATWREETADKALISVVKTVAEIQRAEDL